MMRKTKNVLRSSTTFISILQHRATQTPEKIAYEFLIDGKSSTESLTYAELYQKVRNLAAYLQGIGGAGQRIVLLYQPSLDYIVAYLGCLYAGSIAIPAYPPTSHRLLTRLEEILNNSQAYAALTTTKLQEKMIRSLHKAPSLKELKLIATDQFEDDWYTKWIDPSVRLDDVAFIQYTSGSTSAPKGVMVSHGNLVHNSEMIKTAFNQNENDRGVIWLPPYHDMGLIGGILQPLYTGFSVTFMDPYDFMKNPYSWLKLISDTGATASGGPNFAYDLCVDKISEEQKSELDLSGWRVAFNGAEPIRAETLECFAQAFSSCGFREEAFYTCYGLAESTLIVSGVDVKSKPNKMICQSSALERGMLQEVDERDEQERSNTLVSSGKAILNHQFEIVNPKTLEKCREGEIGEIWVKGDSVAKGYWNLKDESKETFGAYIQGEEEGPFLRTGDLGAKHNGELYVQGRIKDLIIIRGKNLYPQDIEYTAENSHSAARANANAAFSVIINNEEELVIVQEIERTKRRANHDEMAQAIAQAITIEYGVEPYAVVLLKFGGVPKTSSGKVQRKWTREKYLADELPVVASKKRTEHVIIDSVELSADLASLGQLGLESKKEALQNALCKIITQMSGIQVDETDFDQYLTAFGIDSIKALEMQHIIEKAWGVKLPAAVFMQEVTLHQAIENILESITESKHAEEKPIVKKRNLEKVRASAGQAALYFIQKLKPESHAYHVSKALQVIGNVDQSKIKKIVEAIISRHEALRVKFYEDEKGEVWQEVQHHIPIDAVYQHDTFLNDEDVSIKLKEEAQRPFDLAVDPLMRVVHVDCPNKEQILMFVFHHIIIDLWSVDILMGEMKKYLESDSKGTEMNQVESSIQISDYNAWQNEWLNDPQGKEHLTYWREYLSGDLPVLDLPTDFPRPPIQTYHGAVQSVTIEKRLLDRIQSTSVRHHSTLYMTLMSSYILLLQRYSRQDEVIIGTPFANRTEVELRALVGYVTNTLPFRISVDGEEAYADFLNRVSEQVRGMYKHQAYPFYKLVEKLKPGRDASRPPIYQAVFSMQNTTFNQETKQIVASQDEEMEWGKYKVKPIQLDNDTALFDLTMAVTELEDRLYVEIQYNTDLFKATTISRMLKHYVQLLQSIVESDKQKVGSLQLLSEAEQAELLPAPQRSYTPHKTLVQRFKEQVKKRPHAPAVQFEDRSLTYEELERLTNHVANYLLAQGTKKEDRIAIFTERSLEMVIGILGILKAGCTYVPIDPQYPKARVHYVLEDANIAYMLTQESLLDRLPSDGIPSVCLDRDWSDIMVAGDHECFTPSTTESTAYIIYTSGSTGRPKGVMVSHSNVLRLFDASNEWFQFDSEDVWTMFHSYAFDFSVWEMWGALLYGGKLIVVPYWVSRDTEEFYRLLSHEKITVLNQTPSAFQQLIEIEGREKQPLDLHLRYIIFGGEALDLEILRPWILRNGDQKPKLINMYGITETTVHVTYKQIIEQDLSLHQSQYVIGVPLPDLQVYLLDSFLQAVPVGVTGEMYVGGAGVAKGYLNRPELNADRFISNPYVPEQKLYKTGDLAQKLESGELVYKGRADQQVKIRGHRIELGEIKVALLQMEDIKEAVIIAKEDQTGQKNLTAYLVSEGEELSSQEIKQRLKRDLPDYMVPKQFMYLKEIPLTANGKIDQSSLPSPDNTIKQIGNVAPVNSTEQTIVNVWKEVLENNNVSTNDNFFDLGGDSIRCIRVISRLKDHGIHVSLQELYRYQTISELSRATEEQVKPIETGSMASTEPFSLLSLKDKAELPESLEDAYPLTSLQAGLVFHREYSTDYKNYISTFKIRAHYNEAALKNVIERITDRHPMLRTSFSSGNYSEPLQLVHQKVKPNLVFYDWRKRESTKQQIGLEHFFLTEENKRIDWETPPLVYFYVHRLTDDVLQFTMTEPFLDGWSVASLITEIFRIYSLSLANDDLLTPDKLNSTFRDYVALEKQSLQDEESQAFWMSELQDCSPNHLPAWEEFDLDYDLNQNRYWVDLPQSVSDQLLELSKSLSLPLKSVLLAAHIRVVSMLSGQKDVITGMFENGRLEQYQGEEVIGLFLNTVPFRTILERRQRWIDLIQKVFEKERDLLPYRRFPMAELQRQYGKRQNLFETAFNYTHFHIYEGLQSIEDLEVIEAEHTDYTFIHLTAQFTFDIQTNRIKLRLDYNPNKVPIEQVKDISQYYVNVLAAMATNPKGEYTDRSFLSTQDYSKMMNDWNDTESHQEGKCLPVTALFERQVERVPDKKAISDGYTTLTYRELNERANQLAHYLLTEQELTSESKVGIYLHRSLQTVVALLGVLKAGAAYVPLDPAYPKERVDHMIQDAELDVILTSGQNSYDYRKDEGSIKHVRYVQLEDMSMEQYDTDNVHQDIIPEQLAYVIYTSGSTGKPKGVQIEHRNLTNLLLSMQKEPGMEPEDVLLAVTSISFDIAGLELFLPLISGATVVVAPAEVTKDGFTLKEFIQSNEATLMQATPSTWSMLFHAGWNTENDRKKLKILCGGEPLSPDLAAQLLQHGEEVWNLYGPTETTIWSTAVKVEEKYINQKRIPIGRPIRNTQVYILDPFDQPVPLGVIGEVCIGGAGVSRGYLKRPLLTEEKFVPHPFNPSLSQKIYRTGDYARFYPDGTIDYLGRKDDQLKVRGHRVEVGEIESYLLEHDGVKQAVVVGQNDASGENLLIAYFIPKGESIPEASNLLHFMKRRLPDYMVPLFYMPLETFPLLPNGKLNRKGLPPIERIAQDIATDLEEPQTQTEKEVARIWAEVLSLPKVGLHQNFFDLGGHSLIATQLVSRIRLAYGVDLAIRHLMENPTVYNIAQEIDRLIEDVEDEEELEALLDQVDGLSDEEIEELLKDRRA